MGQRRSILCVAFFCFVIGASCVTDEAHRYYAKDRYPPKQPEEVQILNCLPARKHVVIADFQARGADAEYMRKLAAEIGADAVIVGTYGGFRAKSDDWAGEDKKSDTYSRISGTAIRYED